MPLLIFSISVWGIVAAASVHIIGYPFAAALALGFARPPTRSPHACAELGVDAGHRRRSGAARGLRG
eukprot:3262303-Lingulodinium_polyedra.AAC.1